MALRNDLAEIHYLAVRCGLILDALAQHEPDAPFVESMRDVVRQTAEHQNARGLRTIRRDLLEMMAVLPEGQRGALQAQLDLQAHDDPTSRPR